MTENKPRLRNVIYCICFIRNVHS